MDRTPSAERGVDDVGDRLTQRFSANVAAEHVAQVGDAFAMITVGYPLQPSVGSESVQAQQ